MDEATGGINALTDPKAAGIALLRQGKFDQAAAVLREAVAIEGEDEETYSLLGAALASKGDAPAAVDAFKRAAELGPAVARNFYNLGLAYQSAGRLPDAKRSLEQALSLNPGYEQARAKLSEIAQHSGASPSFVAPIASSEGTTNIGGGGDTTGLLSSVGQRYTPPPAEGTTNIGVGGNSSALSSLGQAAPAPAQEGHTNISGSAPTAASMSLADVGMGRAVVETGHTNIGGGATAASGPPSAAPTLRAAPPSSVGPTNYTPPASYAPPGAAPNQYGAPVPQLGTDYAVAQNSSGMQGDVPAEIAGGFNWGAFMFGWIWFVAMHMKQWGWTYLIVSIVLNQSVNAASRFSTSTSGAAATGIVSIGLAVAQFAFAIFMGFKGNQWAWQNRRWDSVEDFKACQRIWGWWALGWFIMGVVLMTVVFALLGAAIFSGLSGAGGRRF